MVLEATVLVIDNSEWMRNGDYPPSRLDAQADAVTFLFNAKTQSNPENTVGLMTMSGKGPEVLVTLTSDVGKILTSLHHVKISGKPDLLTGVQIAQLALKHRQNKNQRQRIIVFVGSPLEEDEKTLVKLAKKLKKNNVAVDIVNFGEDADNQAKLEQFIENVNSSDNSHLVTVPPGPHLLSDVLISSPIIQGEDGAGAAFAGGSGGGNYEFGVDASLDPELALALRISLEEERARQDATKKPEAAETAVAVDDKMDIDTGASSSGSGVAGTNAEDEMLAKALQLSMGGAAPGADLTEEEQIAQAIAMSMQAGSSGKKKESKPVDLASVLGSLPGVNPSDPKLKDAAKKEKEDKNGKK